MDLFHQANPQTEKLARVVVALLVGEDRGQVLDGEQGMGMTRAERSAPALLGAGEERRRLIELSLVVTQAAEVVERRGDIRVTVAERPLQEWQGLVEELLGAVEVTALVVQPRELVEQRPQRRGISRLGADRLQRPLVEQHRLGLAAIADQTARLTETAIEIFVRGSRRRYGNGDQENGGDPREPEHRLAVLPQPATDGVAGHGIVVV